MTNNIEQEIAALRMKIKSDPTFSIELLAAISQICREHKVILSKELLSRLVLAKQDELVHGLSV
ncbi:hypothetical protein ABTE62_19520, partial [Acinetobacter baumannii]